MRATGPDTGRQGPQGGRRALAVAAVLVALFGVLTVFSGGRALFGGPEARAAVGDAVPFVLWFNFIAGFAYVAAGAGLFLRRPWAMRLSIAILAATIAAMIAFGVHTALGGAYEMRTVGAMSLRILVWAAVAAMALRAAG
ncbi:hypothetical protein [Pikeienuella sp. HZG-20]|uniref:hypothetical protein n=1 Tax=Paludibacillus litoralis TaxID=3133267 RepID=UPI0030EC7044